MVTTEAVRRTIDPTTPARVEHAIADERRAFARSTAKTESAAAVLEVGGGCAVFTGPNLFSNRAFALGLTKELSASELDEIESFYDERGYRTDIEVASMADPGLLELLAERGYRLRRFRNIYARRLPPAEVAVAVSTGIGVDPVGLDGSVWSSILIDGFGYEQAEAIERVTAWNRALLRVDGLTAFVATVQGEPAGSASVLVRDGIAVLGGAATLPRLRRLGVQAALIEVRLRHGADLGCDLAVVTADPGGISARNCERAGFDLVCTHAVMVGSTTHGLAAPSRG